MSAQEVAGLLRHIDILEPLSGEQLERLSLGVAEVRSEEGQLFYTPSHFARVLFLLLEGRVRIYNDHQNRRPIQWFGFSNARYNLSVSSSPDQEVRTASKRKVGC